MALSMEEQRILAEIERQLADEDPSLAVRLSTFGRPGLTAGLRTPRGRMLVSLFVVAAVALLSLMVYSLMPLRVLPGRGGGGSTVAPIQTGLGTQASQAVSGAPSARKGHAQAAKRHPKGNAPSTKAAAARQGTAAHRQAPTPSAGPVG